MGQISFRCDEAHTKRLNEILTTHGLCDDSMTANMVQLIDRLYDSLQNAKNSQTLSSPKSIDVDIACNLRFMAETILKDVDPETRKTFFYKTKVPYCFQFANGKPKKPMQLINYKEMCRRCKPLKEDFERALQQLVEQNANAPAPPKTEWKPAKPAPAVEAPKRVYESEEFKKAFEPTKPAMPAAKQPINSWPCPKRSDGVTVHYTGCFECKEQTSERYFACLHAHPDIALNLDYWKRQTAPKASTQSLGKIK